MNISIRGHIINNFKDDSIETLRNAIEESISEKDEITLPGMGVFFEIIWTDADEKLRTTMIDIIRKRLDKEKK